MSRLKDNTFPSEDRRVRQITDYRYFDTRTQDRTYNFLYKLHKWMRKCELWNETYPNNNDNIPSLLPLKHCQKILELVPLSTYKELTYGRRILTTFRLWREEERERQEIETEAAAGVLEGVAEGVGDADAVQLLPSSISTLESKPPSVSGILNESEHTVVLAPPARSKEVALPSQGV